MTCNRLTRSSRSARARDGRLAAAVVAALTAAAAGPTALAIPNKVDVWTNPGTASWFDAASWSGGVANAQDVVQVVTSGTINIGAPGAAANAIDFGFGNGLTPTVNLTPGGTFTTINNVHLGGGGVPGNSTGTLATFNQSGGTFGIPSTAALWIGFGGSGTYNMTAGTMYIGSSPYSTLTNLGLSVGTGAAGAPVSTGTLNMGGGTMSVDEIFEVARSGANGVVNMTGGTINIGSDFWGGQSGSGGGKVTMTQSGGTITTGFNQFGASAYGNFFLGLGNASTSRASYTVSGTGALNVYGYFEVGGGNGGSVANSGGFGDFVLDDGTVSVGDPRNTAGSLYVGWARGTAAANGTVTVNSGTMTFNLPGGVIALGSYEGNANASKPAAAGTLNITGGQVLNPKGFLDIGRAGATGTLNLSGGQLSLDSLQWTGTAGVTKTFNWTGGTLDLNSAVTDFAITNKGGTFRPGGTTARTFATSGADGSYVQTAGTLALDLGANYAYDAVDASSGGVGAVNLGGGNVTVTAAAGYAPAFGVTLPLVVAKTITDGAAWSLPAAPANMQWDRRVVTDGGKSYLVATVLPTSASTLTSGTNWKTATWSGGTPDGAGVSARLAGAGGAVTLGGDVTVGYLQIDGTGNWTVNGTNTLTVGTAGGTGGIVAFTGSHTVNAPIKFASDASLGVSLPSTGLTLAGPVSGSATVEKTGQGALTLSGTTSTFSGAWKISGGTLNIGSDANLGAPAAGLALSNATVNVMGGWNSARSIALNGGGATVNFGGDSSLSGVISGAGGLFKNGNNTLVLSGANTYAGTTGVNAGTLRQGAAGAVPSGSAVVVAAGTTLDLGGYAASVGSVRGAGNVTTGGANLTVGNDNADTTFSGTISGGGTFAKNGTGTLTLTPPTGVGPGYTQVDGNVVVNGGTLQVNGLSWSIVDLSYNDVTVNTGANLGLASVAGSFGRVDVPIHGGGSLTLTAGSVTLGAGSDFTGGTTITGSGTLTVDTMDALGPAGTPVRFAGSGTRDLGQAGVLAFGSGGTFSHPISVDGYKFGRLDAGGNDVTLNRPITGDGLMWFTSTLGNGTFRLNAASTYKGTTNIDPSVQVVLGVDNAMPGYAGIAVNGTLDLNNHPDTLGFLVGSGTIKLTGADLTVGFGDRDGTYTGTLTGTGGLVKTGGGLQALSLAAGKANTYAGKTLVQQGSLQIVGNLAALPAGSAVTNNAELIFSATAAANGVTAPAVPTYAGVIGGTGEVQQSAAAAETLALTGNNTYTGGTRIAGGTLLVSSDANLGAASGKVTFFAAAGPVLKFGGAFNSARAVVLESGTGTIDANGFNVGLTGPITGPGALAVRAGAGSLAVNNVRIGGGLTVSTGKLRVATNGTPAGLSVASALSIASGATLDLANNDMIVDYSGATSPLAGIVASFRAAYHDGAWDAAGLTSSAAANAANNFLTTLGIVDNTARAITALDGVTVDNTAVLIKYVYYGDTNLDGKVDGVDVGAFSAGLAGNGALAGWQNGDFNYDGSINGDDYMLLTRAIAGQGAPLNPAVPEPTGAAAGAIAAAGMLLRRGRRRT